MTGSVSIVPHRVLPLPDLLVAELFAAVGLAVSLLLGRPGWWGAAAVSAVAAVLVVRLGGLTLPRRTIRRLGFWSERRRRKKSVRTPSPSQPFDFELPDGSQVGFGWDGGTLTSFVRIQENPAAMTVMEAAATVSGETVPVQMLADCLQ